MNDCWNFAGGFSSNGYGAIAGFLAHRVMYENCVGEIPEGLTIDHLCRNRACINPQHLEAVTIKENILRSDSACAKKARQSSCLNGHLLNIENTYVPPKRPTHRYCKACQRCRNRQLVCMAKEKEKS